MNISKKTSTRNQRTCKSPFEVAKQDVTYLDGANLKRKKWSTPVIDMTCLCAQSVCSINHGIIIKRYTQKEIASYLCSNRQWVGDSEFKELGKIFTLSITTII
jgi:hypothetical protein